MYVFFVITILSQESVQNIYWTKIITQLVNGSFSVWIYDVGQSIWDILLSYSQRLFGANWITAVQYGSLSSNRIVQNGFFGPMRFSGG